MIVDNPIMHWRMQKQSAAFKGVQCLVCRAVYYPCKYTCVCGHTAFEMVQLSGKGVLLSFTSVTVAPTAFAAMAPYYLGLIELTEGARLIAQITDVADRELFIGMPVAAVFRKYYAAGDKGLIHYGIKFIAD